MKRLFLLLFVFCFFNSDLFSQRANIWYFGTNAGLNFGSSPPGVLLTGPTLNPDNTSTISDASGNLLFFTDGLNVYRSTNAIMPNGLGLIGSSTGGQCAIIVPVPCSATKYVIFHVTEFASPGKLHYTVVDMSLNGGLGDVVANQKNVSLGTGWTEKLCAIYNPVGKNYWVLAHKWNSNEFVAFSVTASSIAVQSVSSMVGSVHSCGAYSGAHDASGQLTISQNGSKVVNALTCQDKYELFDFNLNTGVLSNCIMLPGAGGSAWGTAFSPDGTKLYVNTILGPSIFQYDIFNYNLNAILASKNLIGYESGAGYHWGYMELGPNGKLYIAKPGTTFISVINSPNTFSTGCGFVKLGQSLGNKSSTHGLSRVAYGIPTVAVNGGSLNINIQNTAAGIGICAGQSATLTASGAMSYSWNPGNSGNASYAVSPSSTTNYSVVGSNTGECVGSGSAVVTVSVFPIPNLSIVGPKEICQGQSLILTANGAASYSWNNGAVFQSILITPTISALYVVSGSNANCTATSSVYITVNDCKELGVSELASDVNSMVVPNPFANELTVQNADNYEGEIVIQNVQSEIVFKELIRDTVIHIDTSTWPSGIYIVRLNYSQSLKCIKLIKP